MQDFKFTVSKVPNVNTPDTHYGAQTQSIPHYRILASPLVQNSTPSSGNLNNHPGRQLSQAIPRW